MSKKIVINRCYGGFGLSDEATELYMTKTGRVPFYKDTSFSCTTYATTPFVKTTPFCTGRATTGTYFFQHELDRDDPILIEVVEELGEKANDRYSELDIVEIPEGVDWEIRDYDGKESVRERSRSWS